MVREQAVRGRSAMNSARMDPNAAGFFEPQIGEAYGFSAGQGLCRSNCDIDRADAQSLLPGTNGRFWRILLQKSKVASVRISGEFFECNATDDSYIRR
jgi:hypothetical protein